MNPIILIIYLVVLAILFIAGLILVNGLRSKGSIARALNMSLFAITLPRENLAHQNQQRPEKELIAIMEQLFSSFTNIHSKGWNKFLYGEPYMALEMAVHHVGEEINFYISVPRTYEEVFEKQVHGVFPDAEVERTKDFNVFNPNGVSLGSYLQLKENKILPLRTYQKMETDPLGSIITTMSKLEKEGEGAAIQILIRPSHLNSTRVLAQKVAKEMQSGYKFSTALSRAKYPKKKEPDPNKPEPSRAVTPFEEEVIKAIQNKAVKPLFDTNIRLVVSADNQFRADQLLNDLNSAFVQFGASEINSLKQTKPKGRALQRLLFNFSFRLFNNFQAMLMSSEEVTSLFHFPLSTTLAPKIKYLKSKPAEPPANLPTEGIVLGKSIFRGVENIIRMTDSDRQRHTYIVGQTGTGKSTLMKALLRQDIENGKGVCLIDPHGEFAEFALSIIPKERVDDLVYFDPGDLERPLALNMLETDPRFPEQKSMVIDELFVIFDKLYDLKTTGGPMFEKYFKNSAYLLIDNYEYAYKNNLQNPESYIPTLADISRVLIDDRFRADLLTRETNPLVKQFWQLEAEKAGGEQSLANMAPYISSKVTSFVFNEYLRPIINQRKSAFNIREIMDNRRILIVNLSKGKIGGLNADLLGMIVVNKILMAALSRVDLPEEQRSDFFLYIDEFQSFTTDSIGIILSEARKYHLDLIIAHQFIKQLKDNIRDAVFGNVGSIISFRIGPDDAEFMKNKFEPVFTPQDLINIDNLNAYVSLLIGGKTTKPFNIRLETERVFGAGNKELGRKMALISKLKFGRPRQQVEDEIMARYNTNNSATV